MSTNVHSRFRFGLPRFLRRAALGFVWLALSVAAFADDSASIAYRVKAGYLFNFLKFVEWPEALPAQSPYRIAVAADDATFAIVTEVLAGKSIDAHPIVLERIEADAASNSTPSSPAPHLLFITRSSPIATGELAARVAGQPTLTVGEASGFAKRGGVLNFVVIDESVKFEVNIAAAQKAGLRVSSRLSKLAILVRGEP